MLIICPECGGKVSDRAAACPHCGCPVEHKAQSFVLVEYDPARMKGKTPADDRSIEVALDFYGDLLVSTDGRVWNDGGQIVAEVIIEDLEPGS